MDAVSSNKELIKNKFHFHPDKKCLQHISHLLCDRKGNVHKYCICFHAIHLGLRDLPRALLERREPAKPACVCAHVLAMAACRAVGPWPFPGAGM